MNHPIQKINPRAVIVAEESAFVTFLRSFLFKHKLRETIQIANPSDIVDIVNENYWPLIFIDHDEQIADGMTVFESLYQRRGFELFPYILMSTDEKHRYSQFSVSVGAFGHMHKPIEPSKAAHLISKLLSVAEQKETVLALAASKLMLQGAKEKAVPLLESLQKFADYNRSATIALARIEMDGGLHSRAKQRLLELVKKRGKEIRTLCEISEYYSSRSQLNDAIKFYNEIREICPDLTLKSWEHVSALIDLDQLDEVAQLLMDMQKVPGFQESALEAFAHIMFVTGLAEHIPAALKNAPNLSRKFSAFAAANPSTTVN